MDIMKSLKLLRTAVVASMAALLMLACAQQDQGDVFGSPGEVSGREADGQVFGNQSTSFCDGCGTVRAVNRVERDGDSTGVGAVVGAIVGGIAGRQVGGGRGRDAATAAGAVGGAVAGNEVEENLNGETYYEVVVAMNNGAERTITVPDATGVSIGTEVRVEGNDIHLL